MEVEIVLVPAMIIAATEFFKRIDDRDWIAVRNIAIAVGIGLVSGVFGLEGLDWMSGLMYGLGAAGVVRTAQAFGGR